MSIPPEFEPGRSAPVAPPVQVPPPAPQGGGSKVRTILAAAGLTLLICVAGMHLIGRLMNEMRTSGNRQSQQALDNLKQTAQQHNAQTLDELERTGEIDTKAAVERSKSALQTAVEQTSGDDRLVMQTMGELVDHWNQLQAPYMEQIDQAKAAGFFDLSAVRDVADVKSRRATVARLRDLNSEFTGRIRDSSNFVRTRLQSKGLRADKITGVLPALAPSSPKISSLLKIRDYDAQMWRTIDECLAILEDHPKAWEFENGQTAFNNDGLLKRYNDGVRRVQQIGDEQVGLQRSLLQGQPSSSPVVGTKP